MFSSALSNSFAPVRYPIGRPSRLASLLSRPTSIRHQATYTTFIPDSERPVNAVRGKQAAGQRDCITRSTSAPSRSSPIAVPRPNAGQNAASAQHEPQHRETGAFVLNHRVERERTNSGGTSTPARRGYEVMQRRQTRERCFTSACGPTDSVRIRRASRSMWSMILSILARSASS